MGQSATVNTKIDTTPAETLRRVVADNQGNLPTRIQVLRAGNFKTMKYGDMDIRISDLEEMVNNFKDGRGLNDNGSEGAPLNFGHDIGGPAAAWIKGLVIEEDELYADPVVWTDKGKEAILGGEYKFISSEFWLRCLGQIWHNSENYDISATNVYEGAALTNIPMFSGQKSIFASREGGSDGLYVNINASRLKEKNMPTLESVLAKENDALNDEERAILATANNESKLNAEQQAKFGFQVTANKNDKKEEPVLDNMQPVQASAVRGDEGKVVMAAKEVVELREKAAEATKLADRVEKLEASTHASVEADMKQFVEKHAARGAIKADRVESWTNRLVKASDEERTELKKDLEGMADNPALASEQGDGGHKQGDATATDRIKTEATKLIKAAKEEGKELSEGEAFSQVLRANKELAAEYQRQTEGKE
jgi:hypothetical protein